MKSNTVILTNDGKRIAKRLFNHWKHKFGVKETDATLTIFMPDAQIDLSPKLEQLDVEINTLREDYAHLENVVLAHLNRMAQQEFSVEWQHQA